jgi:hypothetical protein
MSKASQLGWGINEAVGSERVHGCYPGIGHFLRKRSGTFLLGRPNGSSRGS